MSRTLLAMVLIVVAACGGDSGHDDTTTLVAPGSSSAEVPIEEGHVDAAPRPLPAAVGNRQPEELPNFKYRYWPNSARVEPGVPYRIRVGTHCGFGPVDFDGSFWEADRGDLGLDLPDPEVVGEISLEDTVALFISSEGLEIILSRIDSDFVDLDVCE